MQGVSFLRASIFLAPLKTKKTVSETDFSNQLQGWVSIFNLNKPNLKVYLNANEFEPRFFEFTVVVPAVISEHIFILVFGHNTAGYRDDVN